jgi:hypothetical protein
MWKDASGCPDMPRRELPSDCASSPTLSSLAFGVLAVLRERAGKRNAKSVYRDAFTRLIDVTTLVSWFARRMNMLVQACHTAFFVKKGQDKKLKPIYNVEFQEEIIFIDTSTEAYCCYIGLWIYSWSVFLVCPFIL